MSSVPSMLNPFSPEVRQNPYPVYAELRRRGIYQLPESNMFLVSRYEDVREVMLKPEIFSVKEVGEAMMRHTPEILAVLAQGWPEVYTFTAEPEQHAQYHALLSETFSVQGVEKLRPRIQHIVNDLIDTFIDDGRVEFVSKFVEPLVLRVLGEIVGIPEEEILQVKRWCDDRRERMGGGISHQRELELARSHVAFQRYLLSKIEERRAAPRDDVITELVNSRLVKQEGRSLNTEELISMIWMLLIAGSGASPYFLGNAMLLLVQHPDQMAVLRSDPSLFPNFVEESLRMETPFQYLFRTAKVDTELGGVKVPAGARVVTMYGAANRDEEHFTDPDRFDVRRPNAKTHLAFGEGIHYCLGSPLSRLEGTIAFASLLRRLDTIRLSGGGYRLAAHPLIRGPKELHLAFGN